ncbi:MAG: GNAT family N-acetyltransferase [Bacteroidia bacterium]
MTSILRATGKDALALSILGKKSFLESHGHSASSIDISSYLEVNYTPDAFQHDLENNDSIFFKIIYNGQLAGYSKIILNSSVSNIPMQNITKLERLYLLQSFYGLNLGLHLLEYNIKYSKEHGQKGIWLNVWTENIRAVNFYLKYGFKVFGESHFKISEQHSNPNHQMYFGF